MPRTNSAERGLQTRKSCAKSILASLPPNFPIAYWCRLCPQIDLCVNIVRKCHQNPLLSAWAAMEGEYHFGATPIAPPGSEMLIREKPNRRKMWGFNAKKHDICDHASNTTIRFVASYHRWAANKSQTQCVLSTMPLPSHS